MRGCALTLALAAAAGGLLLAQPGFAQPPASTSQSSSALSKPVTINFQDTDIRDAIRTLLQNTGIQYSIDNDVRGTVTISLNNRPLSDALQQVLNAGGYTMTTDPNSGVIRISAKVTPPPAAPPPPAETAPTPVVPAEDTTQDNRIYQFIPVNNTIPEFVLALLYQPAGPAAIYRQIVDPVQLPQEMMTQYGGGMMGGMGRGMGAMGRGIGGYGGGMGGMGRGMGGFGGMGGMGGGFPGMGGGMGGFGGGFPGMGGGMGGFGGGFPGMGGGLGGFGGTRGYGRY